MLGHEVDGPTIHAPTNSAAQTVQPKQLTETKGLTIPVGPLYVSTYLARARLYSVVVDP
jgi:hypothetical protein